MYCLMSSSLHEKENRYYYYHRYYYYLENDTEIDPLPISCKLFVCFYQQSTQGTSKAFKIARVASHVSFVNMSRCIEIGAL